jgi:hypothetical protein
MTCEPTGKVRGEREYRQHVRTDDDERASPTQNYSEDNVTKETLTH